MQQFNLSNLLKIKYKSSLEFKLSAFSGHSRFTSVTAAAFHRLRMWRKLSCAEPVGAGAAVPVPLISDVTPEAARV